MYKAVANIVPGAARAKLASLRVFEIEDGRLPIRVNGRQEFDARRPGPISLVAAMACRRSSSRSSSRPGAGSPHVRPGHRRTRGWIAGHLAEPTDLATFAGAGPVALDLLRRLR